jgi:hypothetical protein
MLTNERLARSRRTRPIAAIDEKSCCPKSEPKALGMITSPPPRSCVTSIVYAYLPVFPVARPPQRGEVIVRV